MVQAYPKSGIWYCEELDITLDMDDLTAFCPTESGAYENAIISMTPPCRFEIARVSDDRSVWETILWGYYDYEGDLFYVSDDEGNMKYTFVMTADG